VKEEDFSNWNEEEEKMLQKALRKFPKGTGRRWETIALYLRTKSADEIVKYVKAKGEVFKPAQKQPAEAKTGPAADNQEGEDDMVVDDDDGKEDIWTPAQEQALVKAVKAFPKGSVPSEKDRWARIAEAIPSKNATQAFKHMPIMLARIRANRAAK
jgi:DnaJ family protein C protein 2